MQFPTPRRQRDHIVLHCSALDYGTASGMRRYHVEERGWSDIGYHAVITNGYAERDSSFDPSELAKVYIGRHIDRIGAHAKGYNRRALGVCMVGLTFFHEEVQASAARLTHHLRHLYNPVIPIEKCKGHRELPGVRKACPVIDMNEFRDRLAFLERHEVDPATVLTSGAKFRT
jgi:hypothetical protein